MRRTPAQAKAELERRYNARLAAKRKRNDRLFKCGGYIALFLAMTLLTVGLAIRTPEEHTSQPIYSGNTLEQTSSEASSEASSEEPGETSRPIRTTNSKNLMEGITPMSVTKKNPDDAFITAQMEFAVKLLQQSLKKDGAKGALVSPLSAQLCLAMVANGADGETLTEMEKVLGGDLSLEQLNAYLSAYAESLPSTEKTKLILNNGIWFKEGYPFYTDFLQTNADYYGAALYQAPFDGTTLQEINDWVNTNTDGMIPELFDDLNPNTVMALINTLLFDGDWETSYASNEIWDRTFRSYSGVEKTVKMMCADESVYICDQNAKGFLKYYEGKEYAFAAILPAEDEDILEYVNSLTGTTLQTLLASQTATTVHVMLPKFEFQYDLNLKSILSDMGMPSAFLPTAADFSKLSPQALYIGQATQKTVIQVTETGTKAAAATGVTMDDFGMGLGKEVFLNRPFVYMILDTKTNLPLFLGVMTEM